MCVCVFLYRSPSWQHAESGAPNGAECGTHTQLQLDRCVGSMAGSGRQMCLHRWKHCFAWHIAGRRYGPMTNARAGGQDSEQCIARCRIVCLRLANRVGVITAINYFANLHPFDLSAILLALACLAALCSALSLLPAGLSTVHPLTQALSPLSGWYFNFAFCTVSIYLKSVRSGCLDKAPLYRFAIGMA